MNTMSAGIAAGVTVLVITLNAMAATPTNAPDESATAQASEASTILEDVKTVIDARLDNLMGDFGDEQYDALFKLASRESLVPYLIEVLRDEERDWHARQRAAVALRRSGDPRGEAAFLQLIHKYLSPEKGKLSNPESKVLDVCVVNLPWYGTDEAVDEAFKMLNIEYWSGRGLPESTIRPRDGQSTIEHYRDIALYGLSHAGTDRVLKAFQTGEGIPQDLLDRNKANMPSYLQNSQEAQEGRQRNKGEAKAP